MKYVVLAVAALALSVTIGITSAAAVTTPQVAQVIKRGTNKKFLFAGVHAHVTSARCMAEVAGLFYFCILRIRNNNNGISFTVDYNASYNPTTGTVTWKSTR